MCSNKIVFCWTPLQNQRWMGAALMIVGVVVEWCWMLNIALSLSLSFWLARSLARSRTFSFVSCKTQENFCLLFWFLDILNFESSSFYISLFTTTSSSKKRKRRRRRRKWHQTRRWRTSHPPFSSHLSPPLHLWFSSLSSHFVRSQNSRTGFISQASLLKVNHPRTQIIVSSSSSSSSLFLLTLS